jgi:hypothetical protein
MIDVHLIINLARAFNDPSSYPPLHLYPLPAGQKSCVACKIKKRTQTSKSS